jgi:hypothetical protein
MIAKLVLFSALACTAHAQFVHVQGTDLVAADGKKLLLRGINLGNWLVLEGYMFHFEHGPQSAREIDLLLNDLVGPAQAERFWKDYREQYITEADIQFLRRSGFNSVRVPFDYRLVGEGKFGLLDRVVGWCRRAGLYVILDMHCAPGGQTGTNIDNSWGYPWLFESDEYKKQTAALWREIASHYREETTVIGYDLLNEPIPHYPRLLHLNPLLEPVYKQITAAIREVDRNHIVILGGAQWDSNFDVFGPPFDAQAMYTFHKYWTTPTADVIQPYADFRKRYNVPLWMSESGENTDDWIAKFRGVLEENNIGWAFWTYKKMDATSCAASFARPVHWDEIVSYGQIWGSVGDAEKHLPQRPPNEPAKAAFADLLLKIRFENCRVNEGFVHALVVGAKGR